MPRYRMDTITGLLVYAYRTYRCMNPYLKGFHLTLDSLLVELVPRLQQVQMRGYLILHVIHIAVTRMIDAVIDGLFRGNNLGRIMRGLNPLHFVPLDKGAVVRFSKLGPWISTWWGESLASLSAKYLFENKWGNIMWDTPLDVAETSL